MREVPAGPGAADEMTVEALAARWPDWHIYRGRTAEGPGGWYATPRRPGLYSGTLMADDADGLEQAMRTPPMYVELPAPRA